ncbi:hypothetical protein [Pseudarthrobacter sp. N5]|uniref:hypothetical protein n=1 Tax=Pseudarthrobacter sp. N5 TaxID=3418416 RepID=UPI003CEB0521
MALHAETAFGAKAAATRIAPLQELRAGDAQAAVEVSRRHVDVLHRTMFMGLTEDGAGDAPA